MKDIKLGKLTVIARNGKFGYRLGDGQSHVLFGKNKNVQSGEDEYDGYDDYDQEDGRSREDYYVDDYAEDTYDEEEKEGNVFSRSLSFMKDHKMPFITGGVAVAAVVALIAGLNSGKDDQSKLPQMTLTSNLPTYTAAPASTPDPDSLETKISTTDELTADTTDDLFSDDDFDTGSTEPKATALPGGNTGSDTDSLSGNVYSPQTGLYYHMDPNCSKIDAGVQVTLVTLEAAVNRSQSPCPLCCGGTVYYATSGGKYYHTDRNCQGMTGATEYSKEAAIAEGKSACPVCAGGKEADDTDSTMTKGQRYLASLTNDKSGVKVWMTKKGQYYHSKSDCNGMSGAKQYTLLKAMQSGKAACPTCMSNANIYVYCTSGGTYYHSKSACGTMKNGTKVTLALAKVLGKKQCPDCITEDFYKNADKASSKTTASPSSTKKPSSSDDDNKDNKNGDGSDVYVYATESGNYYHTDSTCSSMKNAKKVTLKSMLKAGRKPCPKCCGTANTTVYVTENGSYYHSYAGCSNIKNPKSGTLAQALAYGYKACPKCWGNGNNGKKPAEDDEDDGNKGYSDVYVYASESSRYYHIKKSCSKAPSDATKVLIELALDDGKQACPTCSSSAEKTVYAVKNGKYFHYDKNCGGMSGAISGTMARALAKGYKACPKCVKKSSDNGNKMNGKFVSGTSGKKVYVSSHSRYYHTKSSCSSLSSTYAYVTLEAALNNGRSACPKCSSSASRKVYATKNGKYYHYSSSCAGSNASSGKLDAALAAGYKACPKCVSGKAPSGNGNYVPGTSGIKVYVSKSNKHFHVKSSCSGMTNAQQVSLETALNYGYTGCPTCAKAANVTVYALSGSSRFHLKKSCAGSAAKSGTLAQALAKGLSPCANCVLTDNYIEPNPGDDDDDDDDDGDRVAPGSTSVYIDLTGDSSTYVYHKSSTCSKAGMKDGTKITLKYALDHDYTPCKHCKPANKIGLDGED